MTTTADPVTGLDLFIDLVEEEFMRTYDGSFEHSTGKRSRSYRFSDMVRNELISRCMDAWLVMETSLRAHFNKAAANISKQDDHIDEENRRADGDARRERRQTSSLQVGAIKPRPPKRVITAYFQFCREQRPSVSQEMHSQNLSMSLIDVTRELAKRWNEMPTEQRARFEQLAAEDKRRYDEQMAEFRRRTIDKESEDDDNRDHGDDDAYDASDDDVVDKENDDGESLSLIDGNTALGDNDNDGGGGESDKDEEVEDEEDDRNYDDEVENRKAKLPKVASASPELLIDSDDVGDDYSVNKMNDNGEEGRKEE